MKVWSVFLTIILEQFLKVEDPSRQRLADVSLALVEDLLHWPLLGCDEMVNDENEMSGSGSLRESFPLTSLKGESSSTEVCCEMDGTRLRMNKSENLCRQ